MYKLWVDYTSLINFLEDTGTIEKHIFMSSAQDPDALDPQDFGFLDTDPDPQKYEDPRIRIQEVKYQLKTTKKTFFTPKTKI